MRKFNRENFKKQEFKNSIEGDSIPFRGQNGFISSQYNPGIMFVNYMNGLIYNQISFAEKQVNTTIVDHSEPVAEISSDQNSSSSKEGQMVDPEES